MLFRSGGYAILTEDGSIFTFSSGYYGAANELCIKVPAVALAYGEDATGYFVGFADGRTEAFSASHRPARCVPPIADRVKAMQRELFARINQERAARGLGPLRWDGTLAGYASRWSTHMLSAGFGHQNLAALPAAYRYTGENIAAGDHGVTVGSLHGALMRSSGHRANMLAPGFTRVGIGVACSAAGKVMITEDFSRPTADGTPPAWAPTPPEAPVVRSDAGTLAC